ncbi:alpha-1,3-mannosyl-glycoprotein 4-beta-N-acetylglucosaminyltransferase C-like isoform X1 [Argopecten irradians]|uniref:alpha-1,3-mannosyl-glycoprotein 4-beta-N-acetylglucosaminyltransferase C-like isoform X1 n=1 Tax=Argopecten irradians TaxID=31199 RepID=UPI0037215DD7
MSRTLNQLYPEPIRTGLLQVIEAPSDFYPPLTNLEHTYRRHSIEKRKWRAKQNFDYAFLFMYSKPLSTYYMQLEDDVYTVPGYLARIRNHLLENNEWVCLEFSELGYIGKVYHSVDLEKLTRMILLFYVEQPGDFTYLHFNSLMLQFKRKIVRPTLFQHAGYQSSLYGKIQKLQDRFFNLTPKVFGLENPPARLYTTIPKVNPQQPLFMAYDMVGGYFWTQCKPKQNNTITIIFDTPQTIDQIVILTGSEKYPQDVIHNGKLEASLGLIKTNNDTVRATCINDVLLGNFNGDTMMNITDVSKTLDSRQVNCLRITITRNEIRHIIIREIAVFTPEQSSTRKTDASFPTLPEKP